MKNYIGSISSEQKITKCYFNVGKVSHNVTTKSNYIKSNLHNIKKYFVFYRKNYNVNIENRNIVSRGKHNIMKSNFWTYL